MATAEIASAVVRQSRRAILWYAAAIAFWETLTFGALAPLLPALSDDLALSTTSAGVLAAAYPAGILLTAVPAGLVALRVGPRRTARVALGVLALSCLGFAVVDDAAGLIASRFLQGAGAIAAWASALSWLANTYTTSERGQAIGTAFSASFTGMLVGPVAGAAAVGVGRGPIFIAFSAALATLALWGGPHYEPHAVGSAQNGLRAFVDRRMVWAIALVAGFGILSAALLALAPLELDERGLSAGWIAGAFLAATAPQLVLAPVLGRAASRSGSSGIVTIALGGCAAALVLLAVLPGQVGGMVAVVLALMFQFCTLGPLMLQASIQAERLELGQGLVMAITSGAWGAGAAVGSVALAAISDALSASMAFVAAALIAILIAAASRGVFGTPQSD